MKENDKIKVEETEAVKEDEASAGQEAEPVQSAPEEAKEADKPESGEEAQDTPEEAKPAPEKTAEERIAELEAQLKEAQTQAAEARDNYLRKAADFENFRKRKNQELQDSVEFANKALLLDIIPTIDNFERAIKSAETVSQTNEDFKKFYDGVAMIEKQLSAQLESKWGLKRFDSAGQPFDPNKHEALMVETSPDATEEVVKEDLMKGYTLKDKVIRTAKVKVLKPQ